MSSTNVKTPKNGRIRSTNENPTVKTSLSSSGNPAENLQSRLTCSARNPLGRTQKSESPSSASTRESQYGKKTRSAQRKSRGSPPRGVHHGNRARGHRRGSPVGGYSNRAGLDRSRSTRLRRGAFSFLTYWDAPHPLSASTPQRRVVDAST